MTLLATRSIQPFHHPVTIIYHHKTVENAVDKAIGDGQNPYHPHSHPMTAICKHPIVKIVAREEDTEFVECQSCGEVFDSAEFNDIALEEQEALPDTSGED